MFGKKIALAMVCGCVLMFGFCQAATSPESADGILKVQPITERSCLSVRVDVTAGEAVSGMRWYNGSGTTAFAMILAAAGSEVTPPAYAEAVVMMDSVSGQADAWTEVTFPQPVTSTTGVLFVTFQYPAYYVPPESGAPLGVGYTNQEGVGLYFVSGEGDNWLQISGRCRPLLEPVMGVSKSRVLVLGDPQGDAEQQEDLPKVFAAGAFPNPFNPKVTIRLSLPKSVDCKVRVFDIRGRLVRTLQDGFLEAGIRDLTWWGRDNRGQSSASGVYLVQSHLGEKTFTNRLVLLK